MTPVRRSRSCSRAARGPTSPTTRPWLGWRPGGQVLARYADGNPNGSVADIAGVVSEAGNVAGLMPHPEHAIDVLTGPAADGLGFFTSVLRRVLVG